MTPNTSWYGENPPLWRYRFIGDDMMCEETQMEDEISSDDEPIAMMKERMRDDKKRKLQPRSRRLKPQKDGAETKR